MKYCPYCGTVNDDINDVCESCGKEFTPEEKTPVENQNEPVYDAKTPVGYGSAQQPHNEAPINNNQPYGANYQNNSQPYNAGNTMYGNSQTQNYNTYAQSPNNNFNPPPYQMPNNQAQPGYRPFNENMIPPEYRSASVGEFMLYIFLAGIPIVGLVVLCLLAFGSNQNKNLKNFARAQLIFVAIGLAISILLFILIGVIGASMW